MTHPLQTLAMQVRAARAAREGVRDRAARTVKRLGPARLASDAQALGADLAAEAGQQIRRHPLTAAGALVGVLALVFHKPLSRWANSLIDSISADSDEPDSEYSAIDGQHDPDDNSPSPTEHDHDRTLD